MTNRWDRWMWQIMAVGLALRLAAVFGLNLNDRISDADSYVAIARDWVKHGSYLLEGHLTAYRTPGYPMFLSLLYLLRDVSLRGLLIAQALLATATLGLIMAIGRRLNFPEKTVRLAGMLSALYPFFLYYTARLMPETLTVFLVTAFFYLFLRLRQNPERMGLAMALGLTGAWLILTKTAFLPWVVLTLTIELLRAWRSRRPGVSMRWAPLCMAWVTTTAPVGLWAARNASVFGSPVIDTHGGMTCMECMVYYETNKAGVFSEYQVRDPYFKAHGRMLSELEQDRIYSGIYAQFIREHPRQFLRQALANLKDFWRFYPRQDLQATRGFLWISLAWEPVLILVGLWGLVLLRGRFDEFYPMGLSIVLLTLIHAISCAQMRYRLPLAPFLILSSSYVVTSAWKERRSAA